MVRVTEKNSKYQTFDELRVSSYYHSKSVLIEDLPPTSASMRLHILRAFYITYTQTNCLNRFKAPLNPLLFGYQIQDDLLVPKQVKILLPPLSDLVPSCRCNICSNKACLCVTQMIPCCSFCYCQKNHTCKNKYSEKYLVKNENNHDDSITSDVCDQYL